MRTCSSPPLLLPTVLNGQGFIEVHRLLWDLWAEGFWNMWYLCWHVGRRKKKRYKRGNALMPAALQSFLLKEQKYAFWMQCKFESSNGWEWFSWSVSVCTCCKSRKIAKYILWRKSKHLPSTHSSISYSEESLTVMLRIVSSCCKMTRFQGSLPAQSFCMCWEVFCLCYSALNISVYWRERHELSEAESFRNVTLNVRIFRDQKGDFIWQKRVLHNLYAFP